MYSNDSNCSRAASARGFMALFAIMLAMGLGLMAQPAAAAPFAYVTNGAANSVSVIDTGQTPPSVVATVPVGNSPSGIAVTPDGTKVYVANQNSNTVSVIRTATNTVVKTVPVGTTPNAVAVTPDGAHVYVSNYGSNTVSVIARPGNTVVATVAVGNFPRGVAVTPDGAHVYVTNLVDGTVSVIAAATNSVVATVKIPRPTSGFQALQGVAVSPDGTNAYVTYYMLQPGHPTASPYTTQPPALLDYLVVINTATNTVVSTFTLAKDPGVFLVHPPPQGVAVDGTSVYVTMWFFDTVSIINGCGLCRITVGSLPISITITPDGAHAYVANNGSNNISVIATATNTVVATVPVGNSPNAVGIVPPPPGVPFLAFSATLDITFGAAPNEDFFNLHSPFTLSSTAPAINPVNEPVTLRVGTFSITYPPGSFTKQLDGSFTFAGVINGVSLKAQIYPTGTLRYAFHAKATGASLTGTVNPVYVTLVIGGDSGATSVTAAITP